MKTHVIFGLIVLFIISSSCKKTGRGYIKGTVCEMGTGLPIANAKVKLYKSTGNKEETGYVVETATTDNNGEFTIYYYKDWGRSYGLGAECINYFNSISGISIPENNKDFNANMELSPYSYIKFRFKKNTTSLNNAYVFVSSPFYTNSNYNSKDPLYNDLFTPYINYPHIYDTILPTVYTTFGNMQIPMYYTVYTTNAYAGSSSVTTPIYINKGETLTYLVEFN